MRASDTWELSLIGAGALWFSAAAHVAVAIYAGVLDDDREGPLEIELVSAAVDDIDPVANIHDLASVANEENRRLTSNKASLGTATRDPANPKSPKKRLHWRARLLRDEAKFDAREREDRSRQERVAQFDHQATAAHTRTAAVAADEKLSVRRCRAKSNGEVMQLKTERNLSRLAAVLPSGILPAAYLAKIGEAGHTRQGGRLAFDLALPAEILPIHLAEPDVLIAVGRTDARCFVRISVGPELFPLHLLGLPVRVVSGNQPLRAAVVDVALNIDASFVVLKVYEGEVGFQSGTLRDGEVLAERMRDQQGVFLALKALVDR